MLPIKNTYVCLLLILFVSTLACASEKELIPSENFFRERNFSDITLSPNGEKIAFFSSEKNQTALFTYDIKTKERIVIISTKQEKWLFDSVEWLNNDQLLLKVFIKHRTGVNTYYNQKYYVVKSDGSLLETLAKSNFVKDNLTGIVGLLPQDPDHILVYLNSIDYPGVYKVNINGKKGNSGKSTEKVFNDIGRDTYWISSTNGTYFVGYVFYDEVRSIYFRDQANTKNVKIHEYSVLNENQVDGIPKRLFPLAFSADSPIVYFRGLYKSRLAIFKADLSLEKPIFELVASNELYDLSGSIIISRKTQIPVGVYFYGDSGKSFYWNSTYGALQANIDGVLKGSNIITAMSEDESRYIVLHSEPGLPPAYLLGDRDRKGFALIGEQYPELMHYNLPERTTFEIAARDGLKLQLFLTTPVGGDNKRFPAIILPHGGPHVFDTQTFDLMAAFLASRGFLVLQINFRGSSGLGAEFLTAGYKNWGLKIQQDITDATRWLIDHRAVDKNRICIVGYGFGGYAALMGVIQSPNLYQCAISISGVTDLVDLINFRVFSIGHNENVIDRLIGNRWLDRKQLKLTSPIEHLEKLDVPILLVHGEADDYIPYRQSKKFYAMARKKNKNVKLVTLKEELNEIVLYENRRTLFSEIEAFLLKYSN